MIIMGEEKFTLKLKLIVCMLAEQKKRTQLAIKMYVIVNFLKK
jgi:hypothetical protein